MIQITQWSDPDDTLWCNKNKRYITTRQWLDMESERIRIKKHCRVVIETNSIGQQAIFREKLK